MTIEDVAKICHQANKAYCESQGDHSQTNWEDAPDWQRQSGIKGVEFALRNPDLTPEDQHNSWMKAKEEDGWVCGSVKDAEAKIHPSLVPYGQLTIEERAKDLLFRNIVKSFSHFVG